MDVFAAGQEARSVRGSAVTEPHQRRVFTRWPMGRLHKLRTTSERDLRAAVTSDGSQVPGLEKQRGGSGVVARRTSARVSAGGRRGSRPDHYDTTELFV